MQSDRGFQVFDGFRSYLQELGLIFSTNSLGCRPKLCARNGWLEKGCFMSHLAGVFDHCHQYDDRIYQACRTYRAIIETNPVQIMESVSMLVSNWFRNFDLLLNYHAQFLFLEVNSDSSPLLCIPLPFAILAKHILVPHGADVSMSRMVF